MPKPAPAVHLETTLPNLPSAKTIAAGLLEARLVACVWYVPLESEYWWEGARETSKEILLICKTSGPRAAAAARYIEANHPYEVPYIARQALQGVPASYRTWLRSETR